MKHRVSQADQGRRYSFSFCHFSAHTWPHLWLSSARGREKKCFCAGGVLQTEGERGKRSPEKRCKGSPSGWAAEPGATYSSCASSADTQAVGPLQPHSRETSAATAAKAEGDVTRWVYSDVTMQGCAILYFLVPGYLTVMLHRRCFLYGILYMCLWTNLRRSEVTFTRVHVEIDAA